MPGEFEPHQGCILIWPKRPGSWGYEAKAAGNAFAAVIKAVAQSEKVYVAVTKKTLPIAQEKLFGENKNADIMQRTILSFSLQIPMMHGQEMWHLLLLN